MNLLKIIKSHRVAYVVIYGGAAALLAGALWLAWQYVQPAPPKSVTLAAGGPNGAYFKYAREYAEYFEKEGIKLNILETGGSVDNLARMAEPDSGVDAAFMQGGIATPAEYPDLRSLGSLYYEPLWIFYRYGLRMTNLFQLEGKKVAIGAPGSGTNHLIRRLLDENGVSPDNTTLLEEGGPDVVARLLKKKVDAMFVVGGVDSPIVKALTEPGVKVHLLTLRRAEAYARSHHYLKRLVLPEGALSLSEDLPSADVNMLAPTANLVVREDLHPAIKFLFLLAARDIHRKGDVFSLPGTFPNGDKALFPLTPEAETFFEKGPPLLMRYLPYALAVNLERLKILLIPLLTLLYPLFKVTPPAFRWQIRRRIFKWYKRLKKLDVRAYEATTPEEAAAIREELNVMDKMVMETSVPLSYTDAIYSLRIHMNLIRTRLKDKFGDAA
jgi:TRAP transporter TAXI family solute receptor